MDLLLALGDVFYDPFVSYRQTDCSAGPMYLPLYIIHCSAHYYITYITVGVTLDTTPSTYTSCARSSSGISFSITHFTVRQTCAHHFRFVRLSACQQVCACVCSEMLNQWWWFTHSSTDTDSLSPHAQTQTDRYRWMSERISHRSNVIFVQHLLGWVSSVCSLHSSYRARSSLLIVTPYCTNLANSSDTCCKCD